MFEQNCGVANEQNQAHCLQDDCLAALGVAMMLCKFGN